MPTGEEFKALTHLRLQEAETLFQNHLYDGCVYLCGYVVEFALKARVCKVLSLRNYPDTGEIGRVFRVHDFDRLKVLAGMESEIDSAKNKALFDNWSTATRWKPEQRYDVVGTQDKAAAEDVLRSIKEKPNGVLTWLTSQW